jgi:hypothetical protein
VAVDKGVGVSLGDGEGVKVGSRVGVGTGGWTTTSARGVAAGAQAVILDTSIITARIGSINLAMRLISVV